MVVPDPPRPFDPDLFELPAGQELFRVHNKSRHGHDSNPGVGQPTRFAFFGDPVVPAMYAAQTERAAIAETLLHDIPLVGGQLTPSAYRDKLMSRLTVNRDLRMASLMGLGLRRLGVSADQVTATAAAHYERTVLWAEAAYEAGFDGVAYMSRQCNSDRAYVFFGDRTDDAFDLDPSYRWNFGDPLDGRPQLITFCNVLGVEVLVR
ncbi:RES family NAD+ phosphorylase [Leifsonia sp. McL0607]|uniref:RES family NAD+ phosphorylase n=1 Tax=Leifsonia sp. McL0607 TaxID=3415672 RepID=UPI003CEC0D10